VTPGARAGARGAGRAAGRAVTAGVLLADRARWAAGRAAGLGAAWPPGPPPRVALQAGMLHHVPFLAALGRALRAHRGVEPVVLVDGRAGADAAERAAVAAQARAALGLPAGRVRPAWRAAWSRLDLVVHAHTATRFLPGAARHALLYHGAGTPVAWLGRRRAHRSVWDFDAVLVAGPWDRDLLLAHRPPGAGTGVRTVGCPWLDALPPGAPGRDAYLDGLGLAAGGPVVLYAPHWSRLRAAGPAGPALVAGVAARLAAAGCRVVVKLHHFSRWRTGGGGVRWDATLRAPAGGRLAVDEAADDLPALQHADVLVTDVSSRLLNACLLDRPVVLHDPVPGPAAGGGEPRPAWWDLAARAADVAATPGDLVPCVRRAAAGPERLREVRREVAARFFAPRGGAGPAAAAALADLLPPVAGGRA
jgi:hypothetical protein